MSPRRVEARPVLGRQAQDDTRGFGGHGGVGGGNGEPESQSDLWLGATPGLGARVF